MRKGSGHSEREKQTQREKYHALKLRVLNHYSDGQCICKKCDFADPRALCIDHIKGDGAEHRREIGRGIAVYTWLERNGYPEGFQVLCLNCNHLKAYDEGEFTSHKKPRRTVPLN